MEANSAVAQTQVVTRPRARAGRKKRSAQRHRLPGVQPVAQVFPPLDGGLFHAFRQVVLARTQGRSMLDVSYLLGVHASAYTRLMNASSKDGAAHISPPRGILMRYCVLHPEDVPLEPLPQVDQIIGLLSDNMPTHLASSVKPSLLLSILCGCSLQTVNRWLKGHPVKPVIAHLLRLIERVVRGRGASGVQDLLDVVLQDAAARGLDQEKLLAYGWRNR